MSDMNDKRTRIRVDEYRLNLARAIASISHSNSLMGLECRDNGWDGEIVEDVNAALCTLGKVLVALTLWYEDEENGGPE